MMTGRILYIQALSPIHTGTGQSVDVIDLPVAREKTTGWPYLPGSSIKGVLRDECKDNEKPADKLLFKAVFGSELNDAEKGDAGALLFGDARLLCLPVRSFTGVFAWVTCPAILRRYQRDLQTAGRALEPRLSCSLRLQLKSQETTQEYIATCSTTSLKLVDKVYLEDLDIQVLEEIVDTSANFLAEQILPCSEKDHFMEHFAVVSDDLFTFLAETATEIVARIKMKDDSKTVQRGGLWYEEAIPTEALFWTPIIAAPRGGLTARELFDYLTNKRLTVVQIGGNASVGRGLVRIILQGQEGNE